MTKQSLLFFLTLFLCVNACAETRLRPAEWATPVIGTELDNLYQVSKHLFRSEQPDATAFQQLEKFGIHAVLNLRHHHTDNHEAEHTKLRLHHIKMDAGSITSEQLYQSLHMIKKSNEPVLVHCWHGSDRTGTVVAAYRMAFQNWSKEQAIDEFKQGGYGYHHNVYPNLITLLEQLDIPALQKRLGVKAD